jgi:hypothetical protein
MPLVEHITVLAAVCLVATAPADADSPDYERDMAPVLKKHCMVCHSGATTDVSGKLRMETTADLLKGGVSGPAFVPNKSSESLIVKRLEGTIKPKMPLQSDLKAKDITLIKAWIDAGAPIGGVPETPTHEPAPELPPTKPAPGTPVTRP